MKSYSFQVFADYNQVLLHDGSCEGDLSESWNDEAYKKMIVASDDALAVSTMRNMDVPVEVVVNDGKPSVVPDDWDHIVQCNLGIPSGSLVVRGVSDYLPDAARIELESGQYTAWVLYGGLNTVSDDGLDGEDKYKIILWRSDDVVLPEVIKDSSS